MCSVFVSLLQTSFNNIFLFNKLEYYMFHLTLKLKLNIRYFNKIIVNYLIIIYYKNRIVLKKKEFLLLMQFTGKPYS